jgi:hypothetical protein
MGWNSANYIFDPVAEVLVQEKIDPKVALKVLVTLIRNLQSEDWDTEDESLEDFKNYPVVVEAFKMCGVPDRGTFDEGFNVYSN